jgi:hypothetical protein
MLQAVVETDSNDAAWEKRILWLLLISVVAAIGLPVLWMNEVINLPVAISAGGVLWAAMFAWFGRTLARERNVSFREALRMAWRMGRR